MSSEIERYRVLRTVHEGLYGATAQAEDIESGQPVALQRILVGRASAEQVLPRLLAQVETLGKLSLRGVRRPLRAGHHPEGGVFIAWEWIEGRPLRLPAKSAAHALRWVLQVAAVLEDAHRTGFVHLLLRPSQILVSRSRGERSSVSLLGLGLASALGLPSQTVGPPAIAYIAPEVRTAGPPGSEAADIFSLGRLLGALLGVPPVGPAVDLEKAQVPLSVTQRQRLAALLERMLHPSPAERPPLAEVAARLRELQPRAAAPDLAMGWTPPPAEPPGGDPLIGQDFGNFRILRRLGQGGMGAVYEAKHTLIGFRAAVKVLKESLTSPDYARRFLDEARAVNIVAHPGLVSIFEFGQRPRGDGSGADGLLYIVMEHLPGTTLERLLQQRPLPEAELLPLALQMARALEAAHKARVVHRDLKPSNVMLVPDPLSPGVQRVKILDFGIAKVKRRETPTGEDGTEVGTALGTPAYMAPEQHEDARTVTGKADVFALGVLLFEALTAQLPFGEASTLAVLMRPAPAARSISRQVSAPLSALIASMLQAEPEARPTMSEVAAVLERLVERQGRRRPLRIAAAALGAVGIAGGVAAWLLLTPSPRALEERYVGMRQRASEILHEAAKAKPGQPPELRQAALQALGDLHFAEYGPWLIEQIPDPDVSLTCTALRALGSVGGLRAQEVLKQFVTGPGQPRLRACALSALLKLPTDPPASSVREAARTTLAESPRDRGLLPLDRAELASGLLDPAEQTAPVLVGALTSTQLPPELRPDYIESLGVHGDDPAKERARQQLRSIWATQSGAQLKALAALIWLGWANDRDRKIFDDAARNPANLEAAVLRYKVDGQVSCEALWQVLVSDQEPDPRRQRAAEGLAYCRDYAAKLDGRLAALAHRPRVQIAAAESLLYMVGPDPRSSFAAQPVVDYQSDAPSAARLAYASFFEDSDDQDDQIEDALRPVLRQDRSDAILDIAARRLHRARRARTLLGILAEDLKDPDSPAYKQSLHAVRALLRVFPEAKPPVQLSQALRGRLSERLGAGPERFEELVLRSLLARGGDGSEARVLRGRLRELDGSSPNDARLVIELSDADGELVGDALADTGLTAALRLAAAQRRVEHGQRDRATLDALRQLLEQNSADPNIAPLAYLLLYRAGEPARRRADLPELFARGELTERWVAARLLAYLPLAEALPLLERASLDPAPVIRREVSRAAWDLYQKTQDGRLLGPVRRLASDPELPVRIKAAWVLAQLASRLGLPVKPVPRRPKIAQGPDRAASPPTSPTAPAAKPAEAPARPAKLAAAPDPSRALSEQLSRASELRRSNKLAEATQVVEDLLGKLKRSPGSELYARALFLRGDIRLDQGNLSGALADWNEVWRSHLQKPLAVIPPIKSKLESLRGRRVGRLSLFVEKNGQCVLQQDSLELTVGQITTGGKKLTIRPGERTVDPPSCRDRAGP